MPITGHQKFAKQISKSSKTNVNVKKMLWMCEIYPHIKSVSYITSKEMYSILIYFIE